jgi:hypothetical protein
MSLEAKIEALTNAVVALTEAQTDHTEKLNAVLAAGGKSASAGEGDEKPKRTRTKKEPETGNADNGDDAGDGAEDAASKLTNETVKMKIVAPWLGEFAKVEGDPETDARKTKIKGALAKLVGKEGATVADVPAKDLQRLVDWVSKQKEVDNGFGKGRLTAAPGSEDAGSDDEEI